MALSTSRRSADVLVQAGLFVFASTLVLTAAFLGLVGLLTGAVTGLQHRLPFYVLAMALAFVGAIVTFEAEFRSGRRVLTSAGLAGLTTFALVSLGGEGIAYAVQESTTVLSSSLVFYVLAAGLMATGLAYLGMRHWEELTRSSARL